MLCSGRASQGVEILLFFSSSHSISVATQFVRFFLFGRKQPQHGDHIAGLWMSILNLTFRLQSQWNDAKSTVRLPILHQHSPTLSMFVYFLFFPAIFMLTKSSACTRCIAVSST